MIRLTGMSGCRTSTAVTTPSYSALDDFIGSYFHQDWRLDHASRADVVSLLVRTRPELAHSVTQDLQALLAEERTDEQLRDLLLWQYHLSYDPWRDEISMREWLSGLLREIEEALERNDEDSINQRTL